MNEHTPLIITCGITWDNHVKSTNPGIPLTAAEQAQDALDVYNAGASIVHIHRRSAADFTVTSIDPQEYAETNAAIRALCPDIIINNTSGGSKRRLEDGTISAPIIASVYANPEIASLDAANLVPGSDHPSPYLPSGQDNPLRLTPAESAQVVATMNQHGCKPEFMCYGLNDFMHFTHMANAGLLGFKGPHWVQLVCTAHTTQAKVQDLCEALSHLPPHCIPGVISGGSTHWGVLATAILLGAHVRVGMEDHMHLSPQQMATRNAHLVEKIVRIAHDIGRPIATCAQAREMLGIEQ